MASLPITVNRQIQVSSTISVSDLTETTGSLHARSNSAASIGLHSSPTPSPRMGNSRFLGEYGDSEDQNGVSFALSSLVGSFWNRKWRQLKMGVTRKGAGGGGGRAWYQRKRVKGVIGLVGLYFLVNWFLLWRLQDLRAVTFHHQDCSFHNSSFMSVSVEV
uniref:Uncharacterized protein At1g04910-like n=1 Tax=Rhizophora mucronata TaxID=61149 RepID=A0A2P2KR26_RHIMU